MVLHACEDLLHVADTDGTPDGRGEGSARCKADVEGVLVAFPFFVSKETAPMGEAKADCLVSAERLSVIRVGDSPVEVACDVVCEALVSIDKVHVDPFHECISSHDPAAVVALLVASQGVVVARRLDREL